MSEISWKQFEAVELRAGTIVEVEEFPEAIKPAYKLTLDFGEFGIRRSSAQITSLYTANDLLQSQIIAVMNFPAKKIAGFSSEVLVTGFVLENGEVVLSRPDRPVPNGTLLA